jgi:putative membrane protein
MRRRGGAALSALAAPGAIALLSVPAAAWAHAGHAELSLGEAARHWSWQPTAVLPLAAAAAVYALGLRRLWRQAPASRAIGRGRAAAFAAGVLCLLAALASPLDAFADELFSIHMVQHEVLMLLAAPLFVLGRPLVAGLWALPRSARERLGAWSRRPWPAAASGVLGSPFAAFAAYGLALWVWHLPGLYQAAVADDRVHALQHASFFLASALFWWTLAEGRHGRHGYGAGVFFVFATAVHSGILGAMLTLAPRLVYPIYGPRAARWGIDPLADEQVGGLLMWIPAGLVLLLCGLALLAAWIGESGRRVERLEALRDARREQERSGPERTVAFPTPADGPSG